MSSRYRLTHRIVLAFVLMTIAVAGLFSATVKLAVDYVELRLMSDSMNRQLDFILSERDTDADRVLNLGPDLELHRVAAGQTKHLPPHLQELGPGFHEYERGDFALHILVRDHTDDARYVLVLDQRDFERRENMLQMIVFAGFLICVLFAWLLGRLLARRVIAPVVRLSGQVQNREQLLPLAPRLAPDYADDEVGKLAAAFDATLGRLLASLERERLFTSDVSHELRTPLMVIASSCELLLARSGPSDPGRRQLERIAKACEEMRGVVDTLLRLARDTHDRPGGHPASDSETTLTALANELYPSWRDEADARGLDFELVLDAEDDSRFAAAPLRAVMANLVRNALHYTDRGFVRVVLGCSTFSVIDSGVGIPSAAREDMFKPFVRGDRQRGDGIGIGLSLVQRVCESQGWQLRLESGPDTGCTFRVELGKAAGERDLHVPLTLR
ncbi:sensor histidine kinase [Rhodocyclaceae bacterium SMB388]